MLEGGLLHSLATGADVGVEELLPWVKALTAAAAGSAGGAATEAPPSLPLSATSAHLSLPVPSPSSLRRLRPPFQGTSTTRPARRVSQAPTASLYRVDPSNHFLTAADTSAPLDSLGDEARAAEQRDDLVTRHLLDSMPYLSLSLSAMARCGCGSRAGEASGP